MSDDNGFWVEVQHTDGRVERLGPYSQEDAQAEALRQLEIARADQKPGPRYPARADAGGAGSGRNSEMVYGGAGGFGTYSGPVTFSDKPITVEVGKLPETPADH